MRIILSFFRKAKRSGSNVFALFSQRAIQEFKEAFGIMDVDKVKYNMKLQALFQINRCFRTYRTWIMIQLKYLINVLIF
jgi:hypothetical protein